MPSSDIVIKGAREHNLCDVDLVLPRNQLICLTGVSGSGKSSLAFDTLFAEGQRRYVESLSSFARQFVGQMPKPDVDLISGLSPSISISQKSAGNNPRSTVGTVTEIYDYLRVLFARVGRGYCPSCGKEVTAQSREQILQRILKLDTGSKIQVLAPLIRGQKGEYRDLFEDLLKQGFARARVDGELYSLGDPINLDRQMRHHVEVVVDRITMRSGVRTRLAEAVDLALKLGKRTLIVQVETDEEEAANGPEVELENAPNESNEETDGSASRRKGRPKKNTGKSTKRKSSSGPGRRDMVFSADYACNQCELSFEPPTPQLFSFNSPQGMCDECDGLGQLFSFDPDLMVPDPTLSFRKGCIEILGPWKELGRWKRHIYQGMADTIERLRELEPGTMLDTPWEELSAELQELYLWGTGETHITFTWRGGSSPIKYGGTFDGIIPQLLEKYHQTVSKSRLRTFEEYMRTIDCPSCEGDRLNSQARSVKIKSLGGKFAERDPLSLPEVCHLSVKDASEYFGDLELDDSQTIIAEEALKEIRARLGFLGNVGLEYLSLDRTAPTLSGGESQRIRLAGQIGSGLVGVMYILDEPSIGLHHRDNQRLLSSLQRLRDLGNTVVVVEHDEETMWAADHMIDFGPGAGVRGGEVVSEGPPEKVSRSRRSVTGKYLSGREEIEVPKERRPAGDAKVIVKDAAHNNLRGIDVEIPLGCLVCVTGVSGSGKSSLVNDILVEALRRDLNRGDGTPGLHGSIEGIDQLDKLIAIDQSPIGRTPRSNPGTYIKVFDEIRNLFAQLPESKRRGYKPGRFSFNVKGGRCEACEGNGSNRLEMDFLADVWVTCPVCQGHRFSRETLQVKFKDHTIAEILEMDIQQAMGLFENMPKIHHKLNTLHNVGLDYIKLGQPSPTLSGGEAQRIKLARELVKRSTGKTLYLLDEPTTGLHFADVKLLLKVLQEFVEAGNTVLVVEHNLDVIKSADWVIDLGPEGGAGGGELLAAGTPELLAKCERSYTGKALKEGMRAASDRARDAQKLAEENSKRRTKTNEQTTRIRVRGAAQHNLRDVDIDVPREKMAVFCGPSGSGKSSLAMDTIYAEGQRRYVESLSAYARQFVNQMQKPKLEHIEGLSPAIAIEQKNLGNTPRSTVGTVTEVYDYLRILLARLGTPYCPDCLRPVGTQTADQIVDKLMQEEEGTRLYLLAPMEVDVGGSYEALWEEIQAAGYQRIRIDGETHEIADTPAIDRRRRHQVEVVVDRIVIRQASRPRIAESIELALAVGRGVIWVAYPDEGVPEPRWKSVRHSQHLACDQCGLSLEPLSPHHFSFNSQLGWCRDCEGLGTQIGTNLEALLNDPTLSLSEGALNLWPSVENELSQKMLTALSTASGLPLDEPFDELASHWRRLVLHGWGENWIDVDLPKGRFRFQFKGIYPALEEASRVSPSLRKNLEPFTDEIECATCGGSRLRRDASNVRFRDRTIHDFCRQPLGHLQATIKKWNLDRREKKIAGEVLREIVNRVQFLNDVGLDYLTLGRAASSLSNGEAQRIRLASQLGSGLCGVLYVLDEPTIGLHPRDNRRLLGALHRLRDLGNTLLIVEHDREVIEESDQVFDFGPKAGRNGGRVVAKGTPEELGKRRASVTGPFLNGKKGIPVPTNRRSINMPEVEEAKPKSSRKRRVEPSELASRIGQSSTTTPMLEVVGARHNNLHDVHLRIPLGTLTVVTGPSGCGKSSLIEDVLYRALARTMHRASVVPGAHDGIRGLHHINKVIRVDQQPLGNSPASNPATYTGVFEPIRNLFAQLPDAKLRGYLPRRFSFNVSGGRCEDCSGNGQKCIEMHFLPDVWVECETCGGKRYNKETLDVKFHGHTISDVLEMTCADAAQLFRNIPKIHRILQTLCDVGLDYVTLGQPAPTLSGGEAQRVKLAAELSRPDTGRTLYLLDEPTTGLHFEDLLKLLDVMHRLVDIGNTVVLIEHNLDVIKSADWIVDMGPEAGNLGGRIVAEGTPESIVERFGKPASNGKKSAKSKSGDYSHTAQALAPVLEAGPFRKRKQYDPADAAIDPNEEIDIEQLGDQVKMPWEVDGRQWHITDRLDRAGKPVEWEGRVLEKIVDRIEETDRFNETNWNSRSIVEICGPKVSAGWFLHAITAETWLLKLKFRVARSTFDRESLMKRIPLKSLNQMDDLPKYGNDPRLKCKNLSGPWQEIELRIHSLDEINHDGFWSFVDEAIEGFFKEYEAAEFNVEDHTPWKVLGRKWHLSTKGFSGRNKVQWNQGVLESLIEMLERVEPNGTFNWSNQQIVHLTADGGDQPWATVYTKRPEAVKLSLRGPKGSASLGEIVEMGMDRSVDSTNSDFDLTKIDFQTLDDLKRGGLEEFLSTHLNRCTEAQV